MFAFLICDPACPRAKAMVGFISCGYYPSSPIFPQFAIHEPVIKFFNKMFMKGPCSRPAFVHALKEAIGDSVDTDALRLLPDIYKPFLDVCSAWLEVQSVLQTKFIHLLECCNSPECSLFGIDSDIEDLSTLEELFSIWASSNNAERRPLPLKIRCSACFGCSPKAKTTFLCFDGNFQHKRFGPRARKSKTEVHELMSRDLRENRLFIPTIPPSEVYPV